MVLIMTGEMTIGVLIAMDETTIVATMSVVHQTITEERLIREMDMIDVVLATLPEATSRGEESLIVVHLIMTGGITDVIQMLIAGNQKGKDARMT